jgi:hypothetical protein
LEQSLFFLGMSLWCFFLLVGFLFIFFVVLVSCYFPTHRPALKV